MAIGPRLDLRQSQSLVMTPQLRQAIKLLQFSNIEVSAFIDEELQRNPLLERDERGESEPERPAPDQRPLNASPGQDVTELLAERTMVDRLSCPLDAADPFDSSDGSGDNGFSYAGGGSGGSHRFDTDGRGVEELVEHRRSLREHLSEQLRLGLSDPRERMIGAHLISLLDPAGRLTAAPAALAEALGTTLDCVEAVRERMQRFDPVGLFCVDLRECLSVQLADRDRLDPAMAMLVDNLDLVARRENRRLMQICEVDAEDLADMLAELRALDPKPGVHFDAAPSQPLIPDVLMRHIPSAEPGGAWLLELNPETMPKVLVNQAFHARVVSRAPRTDRPFWPRSCRPRTGW